MLQHKAFDEGKKKTHLKQPGAVVYILMELLMRKTASELFPFVNDTLAASCSAFRRLAASTANTLLLSEKLELSIESSASRRPVQAQRLKD